MKSSILIVVICSLLLSSFALHPERPKSFDVFADTTIVKKSPTTNFGTELTSLVGTESGGNRYITLIKFSVDPPACTPGLPGPLDPCYTQGISTLDQILEATIVLNIESVSSHDGSPVTIRMFPTSDFDELSSTWSNSGSKTGLLVDEVVLLYGSSGSAVFTATDAIQDGHRSFVIEVLGSGSDPLVVLSTKDGLGGAVLNVKQAAVELVAPNTGCEHKTEIVNGLSISYTDCPYVGVNANPPTCLWLHGAPTNKDLWRNQHQHVQSVCRSIAPSMPGSGESDNVDLAGGTKAILTETSKVIKAFVQQLDLKRLNCFGQDFGDGVCRTIELDLVDENRLAGIWSIEGVMANSLICSPTSEAAADGTPFKCARDGAVGGPNSFMQKCFIEDISVTGNPADKCGTYVLSRNWFYNLGQFFDPNVKDQSVFYPILAGALMPANPVLIALPFPGTEDVINTLTFDFQPPQLANDVYDKSAILSLPQAPQVLQNWPRTLAQSGQVDSVNSAPYRQLLLDTRAAYEKGGKLEHVPKYFLNVVPGLVAVPGPDNMAWANEHYEKFSTFYVTRGASHYYTEDNTGAQDVGLVVTNILN